MADNDERCGYSADAADDVYDDVALFNDEYAYGGDYEYNDDDDDDDDDDGMCLYFDSCFYLLG